MCTAATYKTEDFYFGRNLDYEFSYGDEVTVTPRAYPFALRCMGNFRTKYAMIGMAYVAGEYPLYYDAVNEKGLGIAGLNFVGNAVYHPVAEGKNNVTQFELIPWLLGSCATLAEARTLLEKTNIVNIPPPPPASTFAEGLDLTVYSRGLGGLGLPGDLSSQSRFVRAAFVRMNAKSGSSEAESVNQFFHILHSVEQQRGCCELDDGKYEITLYTSCCNADKGIYYYTTYGNHQITAVDMHRENLDSTKLTRYPLVQGEQIALQN